MRLNRTLCLIVPLLTSGSAPAFQPNSISYPIAPKNAAEREQASREIEFLSLCDAYRAVNNGYLDPEVEEVFAHWADMVGLRTPWDAWLTPRFAKGDLRQHPDPMVRAIALIDQIYYQDASGIGDELLENLDALRDTGYPPVRVAQFADACRYFFSKHGDNEKATAASQYSVAQYIEACATPEMNTAQRRFVYFRGANSYSSDNNREFAEWFVSQLESNEHTDPWIAQMSRARLEWEKAWDARGKAFASDTSDEQWKKFRRLGRPAMRGFAKAYELDPDCPEAATALIDGAKSGLAPINTDEQTWFNRAIEAQMDYEKAFENMRSALIPRWGGSYEEMAEFAELCASPRYEGTPIPFQTIHMIGDFTYDREFWPVDDFPWTIERFVKAVEDAALSIERDKNTRATPAYTGTLSAYAAYRLGRPVVAAQRLRAISAETSQIALKRMHMREENLASIVLPVATEETSKQAAIANSHERSGAWDRAEQAWRHALAIVPENDELLERAVRDRVQIATWKAAFERGEWVELAFDESLSGWREIEGAWERVDDDRVRMLEGADYAQLCVGFDADDRYEIEATVTPPPNPPATFRFGLVYAAGHRPTNCGRVYRTFSMHPAENRLMCSWAWSARDYRSPVEADLTKPHTLRVIHDGPRVRCEFDGELVFDEGVISPSRLGLPNRIHPGIGGFAMGSVQRVEFSGIRIRKLGHGSSSATPD